MNGDANNRDEMTPGCCSTSVKEPDQAGEAVRPDSLTEGTANRPAGAVPILIGIAAALGIFGFYFGLLILTSDWDNAKFQFAEYRWWVIALAAGLGIQAALFSFLRRQTQRGALRAAKSSMAASGGMSTAAMAACCAHYLVPLLPALGLPFLSAAVAGIAEYQTLFFLLGIVSNLFGIGFMLSLMNRNGIIALPLLRTKQTRN